jgi:hypothetical protein
LRKLEFDRDSELTERFRQFIGNLIEACSRQRRVGRTGCPACRSNIIDTKRGCEVSPSASFFEFYLASRLSTPFDHHQASNVVLELIRGLSIPTSPRNKHSRVSMTSFGSSPGICALAKIETMTREVERRNRERKMCVLWQCPGYFARILYFPMVMKGTNLLGDGCR